MLLANCRGNSAHKECEACSANPAGVLEKYFRVQVVPYVRVRDLSSFSGLVSTLGDTLPHAFLV